LELPYNGRIVRLTHFIREGVIDDGDDDIYKERAEPMLVSLSDLYSEEKISVCDSRSSSCPAYMSY